MTAFERTFHIGPDGKIDLDVPELANQDVKMTLEPAHPANGSYPPGTRPPGRTMTKDQWRDFLDRMSGSITDPTFQRPPQGEFEAREPLD